MSNYVEKYKAEQAAKVGYLKEYIEKGKNLKPRTFTKEQIQEANNYPIIDLINSYGLLTGANKTPKGYFILNPFEDEKTPSFLINTSNSKNYAKSFGKDGKAYFPVSFVIEYENLSFVEAVKKLLNHKDDYQTNNNQRRQSEPIENITPTKQTNDWQPLTDKTHWRYKLLKNYLESERFIKSELAKEYKLQYLQKGKGFSFGVKTDKNTFELFNASKKKDERHRCAGSKSITTFLAKTKTDRFTVFESYLDFLSYLTLYNRTECKTNVIILNGVEQTNQSIEKMKPFNPTCIFLALDRDKAGDKAKEAVKNAFDCKIKDLSNTYKSYKDVNELLQSRKGKPFSKEELNLHRLSNQTSKTQ